MKRGQLLSQPFFYIFAIIVIGLILIFGFNYIAKILKTGCEVETLDFVGDVRAEVNQLRALSFGSSFECTFTSIGGSENRCEFIFPSNVEGICFVDTTKSQYEKIKFEDVKNIVMGLGPSANRNLFFSVEKSSSCRADPVKIDNIKIDSPVCIDLKEENSFIMENVGSVVEIKK